jgi:hypothetical protein
MKFAHLFGSLVILALVITASGGATRALILLTWRKGVQGQHVSSDEALRVMFLAVWKLVSFFTVRWMAAVCSVAVFIASCIQDADFCASLGFASIAFAIVGLVTPSVMRVLRASALCTALLLQRR